MKLLTPSATCAAILLAISPLMAQSTLHGDVSNYSSGPRNVDPGPWRPDPVVQNHYDVIAQQMAREGSCHPEAHNCGPPRTKNDDVILACSQNNGTPFDLKRFEACLVRDGYVLPAADTVR